ncbi:MAG TPA: BrnA antitoxin family protein [Methyloradius sp.]
MNKLIPKHKLIRPTDEEEAIITAAALADPDAQPLTDEQLAQMIPYKEWKAQRGRPKQADKKVLVSIRYSPEVVDYFKATGDGWQTKMDGVLRQYVAEHK